MLRIYKLFFICLFLSSCGFQIIYRENESDKISYEKELSTIRIQKSSGHLSQELRSALKDLFNPDYFVSEPKYILNLKINKSVSGTFITFTGASGRNKVILDVNYELRDIKNGELLAVGNTMVSDNYDVQQNRYGTYVAEDYVRSNIVKVVAQNVRNLLVNDLIEIKKQAQEIENNPELKNKRKIIGIISDSERKEINKEIKNSAP